MKKLMITALICLSLFSCKKEDIEKPQRKDNDTIIVIDTTKIDTIPFDTIEPIDTNTYIKVTYFFSTTRSLRSLENEQTKGFFKEDWLCSTNSYMIQSNGWNDSTFIYKSDWRVYGNCNPEITIYWGTNSYTKDTMVLSLYINDTLMETYIKRNGSIITDFTRSVTLTYDLKTKKSNKKYTL